MENKDHGLGCLDFIEDPRDYKFSDLIPCGTSNLFPEEYISNIPSFRLDQGNSMMCTGFAVAVARYMKEINDSGNMRLYSPGYTYANRKEEDYKGEGAILRQVLNCVVDNGICFNENLSTVGTYPEVLASYQANKEKLDEEAKPFRVTSFYKLNTDNEIKQAIISSGCAVAGYYVYDNWYNVSTDGKIGNNYGTNYGGHCVLIVGWTKNNEWIILNSWGRVWGADGLGYVSMSTIKNEAWALVDNVQEVFFNSLKDIKEHWANYSISKAVHKGYLKGYEDGTFKPDGYITRAEACAIMAKINGYAEGNKIIIGSFTDINENDWFVSYVGYCSIQGLINGYEDKTFKPNKPLSRIEACKLLSLLAKIEINDKNTESRFFDVPYDCWANKYINALIKNNGITGYEDGTFRPLNNITRAEFVTIIDRLGLLDK